MKHALPASRNSGNCKLGKTSGVHQLHPLRGPITGRLTPAAWPLVRQKGVAQASSKGGLRVENKEACGAGGDFLVQPPSRARPCPRTALDSARMPLEEARFNGLRAQDEGRKKHTSSGTFHLSTVEEDMLGGAVQAPRQRARLRRRQPRRKARAFRREEVAPPEDAAGEETRDRVTGRSTYVSRGKKRNTSHFYRKTFARGVRGN